MRIWTLIVAGGVLVVGAAVWMLVVRPTTRSPAASEGSAEAAEDVERASEALARRRADRAGRSLAAGAPEVARQDDPLRHRRPEPQPPTVTEERDFHTSRLATSGPAPASFLTAGRTLSEEWTAAVRDAQAEAKLSTWQCFRAGCFLTVTHKTIGDVESLAMRFSDAKEFGAWPGSKFRSGPIPRPSGETDVTWVLFAPDEMNQVQAAAP